MPIQPEKFVQTAIIKVSKKPLMKVISGIP
jgi:hypothetical protein